MKQVYKAPEQYPNDKGVAKIFLAGAIDQGKARDWQSEITDVLLKLWKDNIIILNPRREDWDPNWDQSSNNPEFVEQVNWELNGLDDAELIIVVFTKDSEAPISFLELGLHAKNGNVVVICEEGFYRSGNIEIVCKRYNIPLYKSFDGLK